MKFLTTKNNILSGVQMVQRAVSSKHTLPILAGIKLSVSSNKLLLAATDLEIGIETWVPVNVIEEGEVVVPAKHFIEIVKRLPDTNISIKYSLETNNLIINYETSEFTIKVWPAEEFPLLPELDDECSIIIKNGLLRNMIKQTTFASSADESRPLFTGVLMEVEDEKLRLIATDTHRLTLRIGNIERSSELKPNLIIPAKTLNEINRLIKDDDEECIIKISENQASFSLANVNLISRMIEGQFPNYRQVIPKEFKTKIRIKSKALLETVERIALFTNEKDGSHIIKINVDEGIMVITSQSEVGKGYEELPILLTGEELKIAFNAKYLIDILRVIESDEISLEMSGPLSPGIIKPVGSEENYIYLILPVRTS